MTKDAKMMLRAVANMAGLYARRGREVKQMGDEGPAEASKRFRYLDEQAFRYNNRKDAKDNPIKDGPRFELALSQIAAKRLTFAEVTGKLATTCS